MATKETNPMNTTEAELKAIARSVGASLSRQGHKVPHSNVLHAVAAALNKRDWHKLKATLDDTAPPAPAASAAPALTYDSIVLAGPSVSAQFYTDDRTFEIDFDCRAYLNQATAEQLEAIISVGFSGDYCTDAIAEEAPQFANYGMAEAFQEAWDYIGAVNQSKRRESIGFEVSVDGAEMLKWMAQQRRDVLASILCGRHGVEFSPDAANPGYWHWEGLGNDGLPYRSSSPLSTKDAARREALDELNLLEQELRDLTH